MDAVWIAELQKSWSSLLAVSRPLFPKPRFFLPNFLKSRQLFFHRPLP
jgi:hypothetical protein